MLKLVCLCALAITPTALANWNEAVDGDLSSNAAAPTAVLMGLGSTFIAGSVTSPADTRDYITFTIAPGHALTALRQWAWTDLTVGGPGNTGFHAINAGATSHVPSGATAALFLGGDHMLPLAPGTDMLPALAAAPLAGTGFSTPLGPGTYSYLVQQTGPQHIGYELEFVIVPAPGAAGALTIGSVFLITRRRR